MSRVSDDPMRCAVGTNDIDAGDTRFVRLSHHRSFSSFGCRWTAARTGALLGKTIGALNARWPRRLSLAPRPCTPTASQTAQPREISTIRSRTALTAAHRALREEYRRADGRINKKRFKCDLCDLTRHDKANWLDRRLSRYHRNKVNSPKLPKCRDCNRVFESSSHYERHLRGKSHLRVVRKR